MAKYEPARLGQRLLEVCLTVLLAAVALYGAVWLVSQVWVWLVGGVVLVSLTWIAVRVWSWRQQRW